MTNDNKDNPDIYSLRDPSTLTEKVIIPSNSADIFSFKSENSTQSGLVIGITLSEGVALCGAYRIDKRLSRDELGETWQASDLQASRNVVVYLPPLELRNDPTAMEPVCQAARHAEALEHPRIVPFLDNFTDPEHGFFSVRKFVNGNPLDVYRKEYIKRYNQFAPAKVIKILSDAAHALDYAHSVDVPHGDLRPKNILVGQDDEVYVDNFALLPVHTMEIAARKPYLSPELVEGQAPSAASDGYALAVVAYELLSGWLPFSSETMDDVPPPIPGVPSTVDAVMRKAMAKDPDDRYDSCGTFVKAFETSLQGLAKIKPIAVTPSSKRKTGESSRPLLWGTLLVLLCTVVGTALVLQLSNGPQKADEVAAVKQPIEEAPASARRRSETQNRPPPGVPTPPTPKEPLPDTTVRPNESERLAPSEPETPQDNGDIAPPPMSEAPQPDITVRPNESERLAPSVADVAREDGEQNEAPSEPETPQDNGDIAPPPMPEDPQPDITVRPDESERLAPLSLADAMREDGEQTQITIDGIEYHFHWCKGESLMGTGSFWIQESPVTQDMWKTVMKTIPDGNDFANPKKQPVVYVSWKDCEKFIESLNESRALKNEEFQGHHFSLPTETQWKHAGNVDDKVLEWCSDWYDDTKHDRAVRGSENYRTGRDPKGQRGYDSVGFRLVIVRDK